MSSCSLPDNFCCCWDLKKGGRIIGGLSLGISLISCIFMLIYLCSDFDGITNEIANSPEMAKKLNDNRTSAQISASILLILSLSLLASSLLLLKGISEQKRNRLVPFLVTLGVTISITLIIAIVHFETGSLFAVLTFLVVLAYFFICTFSLYKWMDESQIVGDGGQAY